MAVKREEVDGALAPVLTDWDRRVLRALPPWEIVDGRLKARKSPWQVAEVVNEEDVAYVRGTLQGLEHRHLAYSKGWYPGKVQWVRSPQGEDYLEAHGA
jgi:hypothetical protein